MARRCRSVQPQGVLGGEADAAIGQFLKNEDGFAKLSGSGRNKPHGRTAGQQLQNQLEQAKQQFDTLKRTQGSKSEKTQLQNTINNLKKEVDRMKRGEMHHRRGQ